MDSKETREFEFDCTRSEDLLVDPEMELIFETALGYQELLDEKEKVSTEECRAIVDDLNADWRHYGEKIDIDGAMYQWVLSDDPEDSDDTYVFQKSSLQSPSHLVSEGFGIVNISDNLTGDIRATVGLVFKNAEIEEEPALLMKTKKEFRSFAIPNEVQLSSYTPSRDFAQIRADYYIPDAMQELQSRLFEVEDGKISLEMLKSFQVTKQPDDINDGYNSLISYVDTMHDYNQDSYSLPYTASLVPNTYAKVIDNDGTTRLVLIGEANNHYCYFIRFTLDSVFSISEDIVMEVDNSQYVWCLEANLRNSEGEWHHIVIPVDHIDQLTPLPNS